MLKILISKRLIPSGAHLLLIALLILSMLKFLGLLFFQPGCLGVDALAFDWGGDNCWLVPPVYLIPRVLVHFLNYKSRGVLVVPFWPSSLFWPYLIQGNGAYKSFVVDFLSVQNSRDVFVHGANKETCFGFSSFSTPVLFLKLDSAATSQVHWD